MVSLDFFIDIILPAAL